MVIDWDQLRKVVGEHIAAGAVPGAVPAVALGSETHLAAMGGAGGEPMRGDAVVRLASMTKPLIAALTLMLAEDGVLSPEDRIDRWIPELADRRVLRRPDGPLDDTVPAERPITVDDLLTMRMGLGLHLDGPCPVLEEAAALGLGVGPPDPSSPLTPDEWIARLARLPLMYQPGTEWAYDLPFGGKTDDGTRLLSPTSVTAMTIDHLSPRRPRSSTARTFLQGGGWGYGVEVVTPGHGTGARTPRYGWGGGLGTVWYSFPDRDAAAVLLTQCLPPHTPMFDAFLAALYRTLDA